MADSETKSVKLPAFDGTHEGYQRWWMRFRAYARVNKWVQALTPGTGDPDLPGSDAEALDNNVDIAASQTLAKKRNDIAMAQFTMAFTTDSELSMVLAAESTDWPNGKASSVVDALIQKFCPQDTASLVELQQELNSVSMKPNDDPAVMFGKLSAIRNKYNNAVTQVSAEQLLAAAIRAAPRDYKAIITCEQRIRGTAVTMNDIESAMHQHWRSIKGTSRKTRNEDDEELTLSAFDGVCFKCGKKGHKSQDCQSGSKPGSANKGKGSKQRFDGKCNTCGKPGHMAKT